jgi:hypothetical protein
MRCMNREIFDLSLSIPRLTPGQGGVGPTARIGYRPLGPSARTLALFALMIFLAHLLRNLDSSASTFYLTEPLSLDLFSLVCGY